MPKKRRKPRSDSKLDNLPELQLLELRDRLLANEKYEDLLTWLLVECGVSSSLNSLSRFYKRHCVPVLRERRQLSAMKAEILIEESGKTDWNAASIEKMKQMTFELLEDGANPKTIAGLFRLLQKDQQIEQGDVKLAQDAEKLKQDERRLKLAEEKAQKADEVADVLKDQKSIADMSDAERKAALELIDQKLLGIR